jgi:polyisoprenoid-binding protein YceI
VKFIVESQRLTIFDAQLSPDKRQEVQERMFGPDVLNVARFPQISFESTGAEQVGPDRIFVRGQLSLHGVMRHMVGSVRNLEREIRGERHSQAE